MLTTKPTQREMITPEKDCYNMLWAAAGDKKAIINGELYEPVGVLLKSTSKARANKELPAKLWEWTRMELEGY